MQVTDWLRATINKYWSLSFQEFIDWLVMINKYIEEGSSNFSYIDFEWSSVEQVYYIETQRRQPDSF